MRYLITDLDDGAVSIYEAGEPASELVRWYTSAPEGVRSTLDQLAEDITAERHEDADEALDFLNLTLTSIDA